MGVLHAAETFREKARATLDPVKKAALGQFFTPAPICLFMASLFEKTAGNLNLLDPGCGVGSLSAAFTDEVVKRGQASSLEVTVYDLEDRIQDFLAQTLELCKEEVEKSGIKFACQVNFSDFILRAPEEYPAKKFTHAILNPPYKKISSASAHRKALRAQGIETVNLYAGFVALAIKHLEQKGELVAIIPRSFCNGPYYHPFRKIILQETAIRQIHIFDSRDKAFSDNEVLQENIIIHCIKGAVQERVLITSSQEADFHAHENQHKVAASNMTSRWVTMENIVKPNDPQQFIHIAPAESDQLIIDRLAVFSHFLQDLGLEVSTGPVVDFRLREDLKENFEEGDAPLLYPLHLNGKVEWPKASRKANAIQVSQKSKPWLWKNAGSFVITRRFSTKEEKRRIMASYYDSSLPGKLIGFDNKLNVFHQGKSGLDDTVAKGLYVYLNSTLLDQYYRQFGGHTQVNATDIRSLHYPSLPTLKRIGKKVPEIPLSPLAIDALIQEEIELLK